MRKISELFRQRFESKLSYRDIARSLNMSISTVYDYLSRAKSANINWPLPDGISEEELYNKLFLPSSVATRNRIVPDWGYINKELHKKGVTLQLLWREYREQHPDGLGYSQFCNHYQQYKASISPVMRQKHKAGEKVFVDYAGTKVDLIDVDSGEIFTAEIFVGCLGASQYIYAEATRSQQISDWLSSHINMFEYFGGVPEIIVPDNLKSGVTKAHRYDPDINASYQSFGEYYGAAIIPARSYSPKDKSKVENAVGIVTRQILAAIRNMTFTSIGELNEVIKKRVIILNNQSFQKMDTNRRKLFEEIDKPALKLLPLSRYQNATWKKATINVDYHFSFEDCFYSVHYSYIGKKVEIRASTKMIECFCNNKLIATHPRSYKKYSYSTVEEHMPTAHQEHINSSIEFVKSKASNIGVNTICFVNHLLTTRSFPQQAYRACLGLIRLSVAYGEQRLEKACQKALLIGARKYQEVQLILKNNLEEIPVDNNNLNTLLPVHDNIRGPEYYKQH
jgi:transposase